MGWIKRNLVFFISGVIALVLLGAAGFYIFQGWSHNFDQGRALDDIYAKLQQLASEQPQPGNDKHDNIKLAKDQDQQLQDWINEASSRFHSIPAIPQGDVNSMNYGNALNATVYQLQQEAKDQGVGLPDKYFFSFQVQSSKLNISSGLGPLAQQLGAVRAISEVLFAARVNNLDSIQRVRVSDDDVTAGTMSDYIDKSPVTNDLAIITPYVVTFRSFTPELARVISGFATSTNPFIVKFVTVQPASGAAVGAMAGSVPNPNPEPGYPQGGYPNYPGRGGYGQYGQVRPGPYPGGYPGQAPAMPPPSKGGLQTILKEQLLQITMEVDVVQLLPK